MNIETFLNGLSAQEPPTDISPYLLALWYDKKGDWEKAHDIVNDMQGQSAAWVHAYLHRKEGDDFNSRYWYRIAGKPFSTSKLTEEWEELVNALV